MKHHRRKNERRRRRCLQVVGVEAIGSADDVDGGGDVYRTVSHRPDRAGKAGQRHGPRGDRSDAPVARDAAHGGPLADLSSGAVNGDGFVQEVQSLESSYEQNVDQQLSPEFPHVDEMLKLAGQAIVADVISLNQQNTVGLLSSSDLITDAQTAIDSVTDGPILSLGTPLSGYATATQTFEANLDTLVQSLSSSAATPLDPADVSTTLVTEAEAYQADIHAGLEVTHPYISSMVDAAVDNLENAASAIAQDDNSAAQSQLTSAISTFDAAILGTTGLFGPARRRSAKRLANHGTLTPNLTIPQTASAISSVSGTATVGGTATLTATLTSPATRAGDLGRDGQLHARRCVCRPGRDQQRRRRDALGSRHHRRGGHRQRRRRGQLRRRHQLHAQPCHGRLGRQPAPATTLGSVSGTASFGGTATLTATLTSSATSAGSRRRDGQLHARRHLGRHGRDRQQRRRDLDRRRDKRRGRVPTPAAWSPASRATPTIRGGQRTGNLVVSQAATTLGGVSGTATSVERPR